MDDPDRPLREHRQRRAARAAELRGQGLSTRAIANRLGVTHPTVLADLKVGQLDSTAGLTPAQINEARQAGRLAKLMGETLPPAGADTQEGDPT